MSDPTNSVSDGSPRATVIPSNIIQGNLLSTTSDALTCFVDQKFSQKLQAFMIGYVNTVYSEYSVYK